MANELILHPNTAIKNPALRKAQDNIMEHAINAENSKRGICMELAKILDNKLYEEDGFKSMEDFAETIGFEKSAAHKYAQAGRVYLSDKPATKALAASLDWSKAQLLDSEDVDKVEEAAASGALNPNMTAKEIKAWKEAQTVKKGGKEKVVPNWHITGKAYYSGKRAIDIDVTIGIDNPSNWAREYDDTALVASVKDSDGDTHYMASCKGGMFQYTAEKVKPVKAGKKPAKLTKEQVLRELARLQSMLDEAEEEGTAGIAPDDEYTDEDGE